MQNSYCNNCGKNGHVFHQCRAPITSFGIIAVGAPTVPSEMLRCNIPMREASSKLDVAPPTTPSLKGGIKEGTMGGLAGGTREGVVGGTVGAPTVGSPTYLVIRRRDTLGFIDFMRGKYSIYNKDYIMNMIKQMTLDEKSRLHTLTFKELWGGLWGDGNVFEQYRSEESASREKWTSLMAGVNSKTGFYTLKDLVEESRQYEEWDEPEWGFPKGRRDYHESDYECAIREFCEETGYKPSQLKMLYNIAPYEEIFTGSNYKSYKHKYFVAFIDRESSGSDPTYQKSEVSQMEWKTAEECVACFRSYNLEKIRLIQQVDKMLCSVNTY